MIRREPLAANFAKTSPLEPLLDSTQMLGAPDGCDIALYKMFVDAANRLFIASFEDELFRQPLISREENKSTNDYDYGNESTKQLVDELSNEQLRRFVTKQIIEVSLFLQETNIVLGK